VKSSAPSRIELAWFISAAADCTNFEKTGHEFHGLHERISELKKSV